MGDDNYPCPEKMTIGLLDEASAAETGWIGQTLLMRTVVEWGELLLSLNANDNTG